MPSVTSLKSIKDAKKKLTKFLKTLEIVPREELEKTAEKIYDEAVAQVPYKTGKLENSIYVRVSKSKSKPELVVGASAREHDYNYAAIQHEKEDYIHPIKGKAHYISDPFNKEVKLMQRRIRRRLHGS